MTAPVCPTCGHTNRDNARFCRNCGAALDPAPVAAPPVAASPVAASPVAASPVVTPADQAGEHRKLVRRLVILGIIVVALAGAYGGFVTIRDTVYTPDRPVRALFAALADRDEGAIRDIIGCDSPLCAPGALQSGYAPPTDFRVLGTEIRPYTVGDDPTRRPNTDLAIVSVRYAVSATFVERDVMVSREGGGLFREWSIIDPPGADLDLVSLTMSKVHLAGAEMPVNKPRGSGFKAPDLPFAPPGVYTLTSVEDPLLVATSASVVVDGDLGEQRVEFAVTIKPDVAAQVDQQIRARVDECVTQPQLRPRVGDAGGPSCYLQHSTRYVYTDHIRWTVVDYPKTALRITEDATHGTGGVEVYTTTPGHATVAYDYSFNVLEPRQWMPTSATEEISPRGGVVVDEGKVVWTG